MLDGEEDVSGDTVWANNFECDMLNEVFSGKVGGNDVALVVCNGVDEDKRVKDGRSIVDNNGVNNNSCGDDRLGAVDEVD